MSIVVLASGGLDSSLLISMALEKNTKVYPLFINYGQLSFKREYSSCVSHLEDAGIKNLKVINISDYGKMCSSGLTNNKFDVFLDAFLPNRNLTFLTLAASYAFEIGVNTIAIGLLNEETSIFPDQTGEFISLSEKIITLSLGTKINIITPLKNCSKADIVKMATERRILETYSCHTGKSKPCGICVACREFNGLEI